MSYSTTLKTLGEIETDATQGLVTRTIPSLIYLMLHKESEFRAHNQLVGRAGAFLSRLLAGERDHLYSESVNTIWRAAGIEFSLAGRDVRYYSSEDVRSRHNILPGDCRPTKARLAPFRALQEKFGRQDFYGLHTFIWWNLEAGGGCGLSTRYGTSGGVSQPGAIFLEAVALVGRLADRPPHLLVAHEIGHFLGLPHPDESVGSDSKRLMHPSYPGPVLTRGEIARAGAEAHRLTGFRNGTPKEEARCLPKDR